MSKDTKEPAPKPPPPDMDVEVVNPRYKGATFEMVVKALLQRPRKADKGDGGQPDEPESGGAQSTT